MKIPVLFFVLLAYLQTAAQQEDFEGVVTYQIQLESKVPGINPASWEKSLLLGDSEIVYIRHGFYKRCTSMWDQYHHPENQKVYFKYKGIDTLFYLDYASDSSKVLNVQKDDSYTIVNSRKCNTITVETDQATFTYQYSPLMHMNPAYDIHNTINRFDVYAREAQSIYVRYKFDGIMYSFTQTATNVQPQAIDDLIFNLPDLPVRKYSFESIGTTPQFANGIQGYTHYLETHLNGNLGPKYIKLGKKEKLATQVVKMQFVIDEDGNVTNVEVLNAKEVHPKLADEAVRVMNKVPAWQPATMFGKKVPFAYRNSITFMVTR